MTESLRIGEGVPVVVDVLRASSTVVTALANGVTEVVPVNSQKEAFDLRTQGYLIAGEQDGVKLKGFDTGNSPTELLQVLQRKPNEKLALKTTNTTALLKSLTEAYIVSTLNLETAKRELRGRKVSLIAVGGKYGLTEDLAVVLSLFSGLNGLEIPDQWVREKVLQSKAAEHLKNIEYAKDIEFIANTNCRVLPKLQAGVIRDELQA